MVPSGAMAKESPHSIRELTNRQKSPASLSEPLFVKWTVKNKEIISASGVRSGCRKSFLSCPALRCRGNLRKCQSILFSHFPRFCLCCQRITVVLLHWCQDAQAPLYPAVVVICDIVLNHLHKLLAACEPSAILSFSSTLILLLDIVLPP